MQRNRAVHGHNECKYHYHSKFHNDSCTHNRPDNNDDFRTYDSPHDFCSTDNNDDVCYDDLINDFRSSDNDHLDDNCPADDIDNVCYDNLINDFRPRPLFHNGICIRQGRHHLPFRDLIPELRSQ